MIPLFLQSSKDRDESLYAIRGAEEQALLQDASFSIRTGWNLEWLPLVCSNFSPGGRVGLILIDILLEFVDCGARCCFECFCVRDWAYVRQ